MSKDITLDHITKIEGHAKLTVRIREGKPLKTRFEVFEGARHFESILNGRAYDEVPILSSRICGICSCIHITAALTAVEDALGVKVSEQTEKLRELVCLGERIRSHATHLYFLALPDYLGYESALEMSKTHGEAVQRALLLVRLGNDLITDIAGRDLHPVAGVVGGYSRLPENDKLEGVLKELKKHRKDFTETAKLFTGLKYPKFERNGHFYSIEKYENHFKAGGRMSCFGQYCIITDNYQDHIKEHVSPYSTSKYALIEGKSYSVGALARLNNGFDKLGKTARKLLDGSRHKFPSENPFLNNVAQAVELVEDLERAVSALTDLRLSEEDPVNVSPKKGHGISAVEAPRGTLFHEYRFNKEGYVTKANIITPTAQNCKSIEDDLDEFIPTILAKQRKKIILNIEKLIRAYDPCISCSTHFLEVDWQK